MLVSWNWLKQYVTLDMPHEELERRLMLSGLNHEGTREVGGDLAIDLEVTSNRPDCLGHLGVAREVGAVFGREITLPPAEPAEGKTPIEQLVTVRIDCPDLCYRYTARVIRGLKVGPSPRWMTRRLETVGLVPINNVVDISNYVLMECGQPLHTFDYSKLGGRQIIVRRPLGGETIEAIDHKEYRLEPDMCVIADARVPVAIGGVMGGAKTEISEATTDVLVEAAEFDPMSIRTTARALNLHSDSSYRFERKIDPEGVDWASRRCCQLILELCGGELARDSVDVGREPPAREPIVLRFSQLKRVLGIEVPPERVRQILAAVGLAENRADAQSVEVLPPSWRRDLTREIDLVEEVGRIDGYDAIPEDVGVPMVASARTLDDRIHARVREVLTACGFDEAVTLSVIDQLASDAWSPWTAAEPLRALSPVLRGADRLRRSLIPSLLASRRTNEALFNTEIELFEIARAYLPRKRGLPEEAVMLALTSGRGFREVKGVIETVLDRVAPDLAVEAASADQPLLDPGNSCRLDLDGKPLAFIGQLTEEGRERFELRGPALVAELRLAPLIERASLIPTSRPQSPYPPVGRDLNFVVDESVRWADLATTVRTGCGPLFEQLEYADTYRDPDRLGTDKKSLLMRVTLRSREGTLTNQQADELRDQIVATCRQRHGAELR
ncbi:MAG: phenylalanine--tRNA ligase subunit beta [Thermoguttaceae bacterium]|jgi:phenylalanyl-tRNA synthetase beta chain|nr:phenylalanine--tRNA ligase subunit beta [Thermoguttaceae bacterium]